MSISSLKSTDLEKSLKSTICSKYRKVVDNFIRGNLGSSGNENFSIPIMQYFISMAGDGLRKELLDLYEKKLSFEDTTGVSEEIKLLQASAFDGLIVGVNTEKDNDIAIYTANMGVVFRTDADSKFSLGKTVDLNRDGVVNAIRLDIEYTSEEGFVFKPVSLNKNTNLRVVDLSSGGGRFHIVPYIVFQRSLAFLKSVLDDGRVLEVSQSKGGMNKVRYVATRNSILVKYCDNDTFAKSLKASYFPLKGFCYCPVVGASSMTAGLTRLDLLDIYRIRNIEPSKLKVEKAESGIDSLIKESCFIKELSNIQKNNEAEYVRLVESFPNIGSVFPNYKENTPSPVSLVGYLHQVNSSVYNKVMGLVPSSIDSIKSVFTGYEEVSLEGLTVSSLRSMLNTGVYKIVIRKKNCMMSSLIVTNNKKILTKLYGEGYFGRLESLGVRLYELEARVSNGEPIISAMEYCGFGDRLGSSNEVKDIINTVDNTKSVHQRLDEFFTESNGAKKNTRKSSSNDSLLLARKCFATVDSSNTVTEYYTYIDLEKIESIHRLG